MTPKISVIVPVYKAEQYLHRCVDSILTQSITDFELILVDDGSPDNSGAICDEYAAKDKRVKVIHKANGGVSSARNVGIENAKGEWITFIDADDYIEQDFLSIPENLTEDLLIQNYKRIENEEIYIFQFEKITVTQENIVKGLSKEIFTSPWAKFFKRKLIVDYKLSFNEDVKVGEDCIFVLDYLYFSKTIRYLGLSSYVYVGGFNLSKYSQSIDECLLAFHLFIDSYDKLNGDSKGLLLGRFSLYYNLISPRNYGTLKKWRDDIVVKRVYDKIYPEYGVKGDLLYRFYAINKVHSILSSFKKAISNK